MPQSQTHSLCLVASPASAVDGHVFAPVIFSSRVESPVSPPLALDRKDAVGLVTVRAFVRQMTSPAASQTELSDRARPHSWLDRLIQWWFRIVETEDGGCFLTERIGNNETASKQDPGGE